MAIPINIFPKDAFQALEDNPAALLIDIRSSMEYLFVGHPIKSIHIAWIDEPDWSQNPKFVSLIQQQVESQQAKFATGNIPIYLICRSGQRSLEAGKLLLEHGCTDVHNIVGGFEGDKDEFDHRSSVNGWRYDELPWEQC